MAAVRAAAILTIGLLLAFFGLRAAAAQCSGLQCDWYIPLSLLLPLLIVVMAAITGVLAISAAARGRRNGAAQISGRTQSIWLSLLTVCTVLGVAGPIASLAVWRDSPDVFVPVASGLTLLIPLGALAYSVRGRH